MNAKHIMLCWNIQTGAAGLVEHPARGRAADYTHTVLACFRGWQEKTFEQRKTQILIEAWHAVIRDGINPQDIHRALLPLDEYQDALAGDMPGAKRQDWII